MFIVELDNGEKVVAKVPMRFAGPPALTTMSEVATLRYGNCHSQHSKHEDSKLTFYKTKSRARQVCPFLGFLRGAQKPRATTLGSSTLSWNICLALL